MTNSSQPHSEVLSEAELLGALRQARERAEGSAAEQGLGHFVGQSVDIRAISKEDDPITAYCYATPYPRFGTPGYRPQHGLLVRPHPNRVQGTIEEVNPVDARLKVKPRKASLYRFDKGYFLVDMFDEEGEPLVRLELKS